MVNNIIKSVKGTFFRDPKSLYNEEKAYLNKPFFFNGTNGQAVLLIHGWSSTPYEVRRLGKFLNEAGYTTHGPQLRGHGTVPKDLENVKWTDWFIDVKKAYAGLKKNHQQVFVIGTSIGANLAILLASEKPEIPGLILMATPYKIKFEKLVILFAKGMKILKPYSKKYYPPTFGLSTSITRLISYQTYPVKSALETFDLIKISRTRLRDIKQACFLIQSSSDHIVTRKSMEEIYNRIGSKIKQKKIIKRAYHTFISDIKNNHIFDDILAFIQTNENRHLHQ